MVPIDNDPIFDPRSSIHDGLDLIVRARRTHRQSVTNRFRRWRRLILHSPRIHLPRRRIHIRTPSMHGGGLPSSDIQIPHRPSENFIGGLGLVSGDFMTRLEHPRETEVSILPHETALVCAVHLHAGVSGVLELLRIAVGDGEGDFLASDPVTGEIAVAVDEGDFDALVEDVG